jgi:hypothetical protein
MYPVGEDVLPHLGPTSLVLDSRTFVHAEDVHYVPSDPAKSSPGKWCKSSAPCSSVIWPAAQAAWSSGTSSLISLGG